MAKLSTFTTETAGQYIVKYWYSYKPKIIMEKSNLTKHHDSGTSKTMINFMPDIISDNNARIPILTAGANQPPEIATAKGSIKFGTLDLNILHVPTFSKSLLSASQVSIEHGCKQT